ncbi:hypothetical protein PWR63_29460 [Paraburkholderia sp. A2WS-5]|uniref:hypothetical protein n=1 Tax=unclassified Paraburkholderia TaxID=2615204 RepID=UPI003B7F2FB6
MQYIEPSKWIDGGEDAHGHAVTATEAAIDDVLEYLPAFDPKQLSLPDDKQPFSTEKGDYREDWLKLKATRYPLSIRQVSPRSASQALVKLMTRIGTDASGSHHPPMLFGALGQYWHRPRTQRISGRSRVVARPLRRDRTDVAGRGAA